MHKPETYTAGELLSILSARQLRDGQVVFAGVGIPLLAATLAQRLRCPGLTILFEGGVIGAFIEPGKLPPSTNDQRCTRRANMVLGSAEVLLLLQRGYVDVGFMGAAQIDQYGNLNSSFIGDPKHPKTRLPGTGGGNDISSLTEMDCPDVFPLKTVAYGSVDDTRDCSACDCQPPALTCSADVHGFLGAACTGSSTAVPADGASCPLIPVGNPGFQSAEAVLTLGGGGCTAAGGMPEGKVEPGAPITICCEGPD